MDLGSKGNLYSLKEFLQIKVPLNRFLSFDTIGVIIYKEKRDT
jgi:hypothetical protein